MMRLSRVVLAIGVAGCLAMLPLGLSAAGATPAPSVGGVVAWGSDEDGQTEVPSGLSGAIAVSVGVRSAMALKSDGTVVAWGDDRNGASDVPAGLSGVIAISSGYNHSLALKSDKTVFAWGSSSMDELKIPAGLSGVTAIAGGDGFSLALKDDGTVVAWGLETEGTQDLKVPEGLSDVKAIAAGWSHALALKNDGTVVAWGNDMDGATKVPAGLSGVTAISAGLTFSLALKSDGSVVAWGSNDYGQSTVPAGLSDVVAVAAGAGFSLALKRDGTVVGWGLNHNHEIDLPAGLSGVSAIAAGAGVSLAIGHATAVPASSGPPTALLALAALAIGLGALAIWYRRRLSIAAASPSITWVPPSLTAKWPGKTTPVCSWPDYTWAGVRARYIAIAIDTVFVYLVYMIISGPASTFGLGMDRRGNVSPASWVVTFLLVVGYWPVCWYAFQRTLGQALTRLRIVRLADGKSLSVRAILIRSVAVLAGIWVWPLGAYWAGVSRRDPIGRTQVDVVSGSVVLRKV